MTNLLPSCLSLMILSSLRAEISRKNYDSVFTIPLLIVFKTSFHNSNWFLSLWYILPYCQSYCSCTHILSDPGEHLQKKNEWGPATMVMNSRLTFQKRMIHELPWIGNSLVRPLFLSTKTTKNSQSFVVCVYCFRNPITH